MSEQEAETPRASVLIADDNPTDLHVLLRESEEFHRITLGSISDAIFLTDDTGTFTFVCPNADVIFGYPPQEIEASGNIAKLLGDGLFDAVELDTAGEISNIEREVIDKFGNPHCILVTVKRVSIKGGTRLFTCRDITERKRAEMASRCSEARYRELLKQTRADLTKTEALYRVNRSLIVIEDLSGLLQAIVESMAEALPANRVVLITLDLEQQTVIDFVPGGSGAAYVVNAPFEELWRGLTGWALREMKPALSPSAPDPREGPAAQRRRAETNCGAVVVVPLRYRDKTLGTMTAINCPNERVFIQQDVELMMAMASQAAIAIEHARLYEELRLARVGLEQRVADRTAELARRRREAETLREVAGVISATVDRSEALDVILEQLSSVVSCDSASVMFVSGRAVEIVAQRGLRSPKQLPTPIPVESLPHLREVLEARRPVIISDTASDSRWLASPDSGYIRCWLGVPLVKQEKVIGLLSLDKAQPGFYTERDAELAAAFADHAAIAIENTGLFDEIRRRTRELEALVSISSALRQAQTREEMLPAVVSKSAEALVADTAVLLLLESNRLVIAATQGRGEAQVGSALPHHSCPHWAALEGGAVHLLTSGDLRPATKCCEPCAALMGGLAMTALVPLKTADAAIGLLQLGYHSFRSFGEDERRLLLTIAEMAGSALQRVGVMETLEQRVADRTRELAALYDVTAVSSESLDLQPALDRSLARVLLAMQSNIGAIHLLSESGDALQAVTQQGLPKAIASQLNSTAPEDEFAHWIAEQDAPLVIPDLMASKQIPWAADLPGRYSYASAPMRIRGRVAGVLSVVREIGRQFNVEEVALLASIADQVAVTVENARLRKQAEQAAIVEERARLALELHDSVTQSLYSATLFCNALQDFVEAEDWVRVRHYVGQLSASASQALREMRLLIYELRPSGMQCERLIDMLSRRLDAVESRAGVEAVLLADEWTDLPAPIEEQLFWIAQEALNNSLKHAKATRVVVQLAADDGNARLQVADDGEGFDLEAVSAKGGMGLVSMRERAERLRGNLLIAAAPGHGTTVTVSLRLPTL